MWESTVKTVRLSVCGGRLLLSLSLSSYSLANALWQIVVVNVVRRHHRRSFRIRLSRSRWVWFYNFSFMMWCRLVLAVIASSVIVYVMIINDDQWWMMMIDRLSFSCRETRLQHLQWSQWQLMVLLGMLEPRLFHLSFSSVVILRYGTITSLFSPSC